ncbi:MAG: methyltransferase domain-containing protein [Pseudorhodoplanes sp.]|nr:methyltransferase domain-containing protein [Pseudorhodoplanes sp.]
MGLYERYIGPRLINALCSQGNITEERRHVVPQAHGVVLEVGIGTGLNVHLYDPARVECVIGVDPGENFLRLGARCIAASRVPVTVLRAPAEAIPLDDNSVDTVVLTYTLCSVADPAQALREMRRVLKPEGRLLFLEHGRADDANVARWQDRLNGVWRIIGCGCNLNRDTTALLREAGFDIQAVERFYLDGSPRPVGFHCRGVATAA